MTKKGLTPLLVMLLWLPFARAASDPFVGYFVGDLGDRYYRMTIDRVSAATYDGILRIDDERLQVDARRYGELLGGRLANESRQLRFRARLEGSILVLEIEDGGRIVLRRVYPD